MKRPLVLAPTLLLATATAFADDHGDRRSSATLVAPTSTTQGHLERSDKDFFRIDLPAAGALRLESTGDIDTLGRLEDSGGARIATDNNGGNGKNFRIAQDLEQSTYYLLVRGRRGATGAYVLTAEFTPSDDHGDSRNEATPVSTTSTTAGHLERRGDVDYFRIDVGEAGQLVVASGGDTDTSGRLEDGRGTELASDDDNGDRDNFRIVHDVATGAHYVAVRGFDDARTGEYSLAVSFTPAPAATGEEGDLRLADGENPATHGRLEILRNGQWGTVCDDLFDRRDTEVACRQLGRLPGQFLGNNGRGPAGTGPIWLDDLRCQGDETRLDQCPHTSPHDCSHDEDVWITCGEPVADGEEGDLRLVGGSTPSEGRLEIVHEYQWGTVCDDDFDARDADVACRQLGYASASDFLGAFRNPFGSGTGPIVLDNLHCTGRETRLDECPHTKAHNCHHLEDIALFCSNEITVAVSADNAQVTEGQAAVFTLSRDGALLSATTTVAVLVSEDGEALSAPLPASVGFEAGATTAQLSLSTEDDATGEADSTVTVTVVEGEGYSVGAGRDVASLTVADNDGGVPEPEPPQPPKPPVTDDHGDSRNQATPVSTTSSTAGDLELAGDVDYFRIGVGQAGHLVVASSGDTDTTGSLERDDGTVLASNDDGGDGGNFRIASDVAAGDHYVAVRGFNGTRTGEYSLAVSFTPAPTDQEGDLRLADGSDPATHGRLEILRNGQWGTVCGDLFDRRDVAVACRQLGRLPGEFIGNSRNRPAGTGPIWLDDLRCQGDETRLDQCLYTSSHDCAHHEDVWVSCGDLVADGEEGDLRLVGGSVPSEGRLEIVHDYQWGTVCDDEFDALDADVACRQLGYASASEFLGAFRNPFGPGSGPIVLDNLRCTGEEARLDECPHTKAHNCHHVEDVALVCSNEITISISADNARITEGQAAVFTLTRSGKATLLSATTTVAVLVSEDGNALSAPSPASVGFEASATTTQLSLPTEDDAVGEADSAVTVTVVEGEGYSVGAGRGVASLTVADNDGGVTEPEPPPPVTPEPPVTPQPPPEPPPVGDDHGDSRNEATLIASAVSIVGNLERLGDVDYFRIPIGQAGRLVVASTGDTDTSGRLEDGNGTELASDDDGGDGDNFRIAHDVTTGAHYVAVRGFDDARTGEYILVVNFTPATTDQEGDLRLADGLESTATIRGRLEILRNGEWGTVCDDLFDNRDADVACRQMGHYSGEFAGNSWNRRSGTGPIWLDDLQCTGEETRLDECPHTTLHDCVHFEDVWVTCEFREEGEEGDLRLVGGSTPDEGLLEILHDNEWGTVCDDEFDARDADVACRQLGYASANEFFGAFQHSFGSGSGPILLDNLRCTGEETRLDECPHTKAHNCHHVEDVGLACAAEPDPTLDPPTNAAVDRTSRTHLRFNWDPPAGTANRSLAYDVCIEAGTADCVPAARQYARPYHRQGDDRWHFHLFGNPNGGADGLTPGTTYRMCVLARRGDEFSSTVCVTGTTSGG